ncbi:DUF4189 domain-containing protein [Nocardia sp. NPDC058633]|uniref:DUF4189 domain-containing protein n=1 Tax=Nocardia sp. NPDC058633 TaxID=3346568 RepID=UPI00364CFCB3
MDPGPTCLFGYALAGSTVIFSEPGCRSRKLGDDLGGSGLPELFSEEIIRMSFMGKVGFAAASVLVAGSMFGPGAANADSIDQWGAMAVDGDWSNYGRSIDYPTRAEAEAAAMEQCAADGCAVEAVWVNGCMSLVENEEYIAWGKGSTSAEAEREAYLALTEGTPQSLLVNVGSSQMAGGSVIETVCTANAR